MGLMTRAVTLEEPTWQGWAASSQQSVRSSQAVRTEGSKSCRQPERARKRLLPQLSLQRRMQPVHALAAALSYPAQRTQLSRVQTPDPENREMIKVCCFKVLRLWRLVLEPWEPSAASKVPRGATLGGGWGARGGEEGCRRRWRLTLSQAWYYCSGGPGFIPTAANCVKSPIRKHAISALKITEAVGPSSRTFFLWFLPGGC